MNRTCERCTLVALAPGTTDTVCASCKANEFCKGDRAGYVARIWAACFGEVEARHTPTPP